MNTDRLQIGRVFDRRLPAGERRRCERLPILLRPAEAVQRELLITKLPPFTRTLFHPISTKPLLKRRADQCFLVRRYSQLLSSRPLVCGHSNIQYELPSRITSRLRFAHDKYGGGTSTVLYEYLCTHVTCTRTTVLCCLARVRVLVQYSYLPMLLGLYFVLMCPVPPVVVMYPCTSTLPLLLVRPCRDLSGTEVLYSTLYFVRCHAAAS